MGCCFAQPKIENDVFLPSEDVDSLEQPLINRWDQLTAPGGESDSLCYEEPHDNLYFREEPHGRSFEDPFDLNSVDGDSFKIAKPPSPRSYRNRRRIAEYDYKNQTIYKKWDAGAPKSRSMYMDY